MDPAGVGTLARRAGTGVQAPGWTLGRVRLLTVLLSWGLWEAVARSGLLYEGVVPSSLRVAWALGLHLLDGGLYRHLGVTLGEVGVGFAVACGAGIACGLLFGARRFVGGVADPYVQSFATTPKIIFLPIAMLLFGVGPESKAALGALSGFFPVVLSTSAGMRQVSPVHIRVGRSFKLSTRQMVTKIYLPALVRPIVSGMRLGLGVTVIGVLLGEIKLSNAGLGFLAIEYYNHYKIPEMYALLLIIFGLAVAANALMSRLVPDTGVR
jgi:ABC-type nitrate/sulfonate/bicarbonate transport system permease component